MARVAVLAMMALAAMAEESNPTGTIIKILEDNLSKGKADKHTEEVEHEKIAENCAHVIGTKKKALVELEDEIDVKHAKMEQHANKATKFAGEARDLAKEIAGLNKDKRTAENTRADNLKKFNALNKDLGESVSALKRATEVLVQQTPDVEQSFAQLQALHVAMPTVDGKLKVEALMQQPKAHGYENQSGGVIDMLKKLRTEFEDEQFAAQKAEANDKTASNLITQELQNQIDEKNEEKTYKEGKSDDHSSASSKNKGERDDAEQLYDETEDFLHKFQATCRKQEAEFKHKQVERQDEITSITDALEELSNPDVMKTAKNKDALLQKHNSFLQVGMMNPKQQRIVELLDAQAVKLHSKVLSALALRVTADPFKKIKEMIEDLVQRLKEEAAAEAKQHGWCVAEMDSNKQIRTQKTSEVEALMADIAANKAAMAKHHQDAVHRSEEIQDLNEARTRAVKNRAEEKAHNTNVIETAQNANSQIKKARKIMSDMFERTAFLQSHQKDDKSDFDNSDKSGGILGILDTMKSEFANLASSTQEADTQSQNDHDDLLDEMAINEAKLKAAKADSENREKSENQDMNKNKVDETATNKELDAANKKFEELKPVCAPPPVDLAERERQRQAEIQSLKEVLSILEEKA